MEEHKPLYFLKVQYAKCRSIVPDEAPDGAPKELKPLGVPTRDTKQEHQELGKFPDAASGD